MPLAEYDKYYGSKKGSANRALQEMIRTYGLTKGTRIFYAKLAEHRKSGKTYGRKRG